MKLKKSLQIIEKYKNENPHYIDLLDILGDILVLREEFVRKEMQEDVFHVDTKYIANKIEGGMPLVDFEQEMNLEFPEKYFHALLKAMEDKLPEYVDAVRLQMQSDKLSYKDLLLKYLSLDNAKELPLDDIDSDEEMSFDLISMLLRESLRPGFEKLIAKHKKFLEKHEWKEGFCPICGNQPKIGEIKGEEGHRHLYCYQCGYEWLFPRIMCPFCGNSDHQSLLYFTVEGNEHYRVDTCNVCKQYIKIVDIRELKQDTNLEVEDIATLHLDILANEEGYE